MSGTLRHGDENPVLPTVTEAAALIMTEPSQVARAVTALAIEPIAPHSGESRLAIGDVFRVAIYVQRAALEEVGGGLLDWAEQEHSGQVDAIRAEIDAFFASLPDRKAADLDEMIASLRAGLPPEAAEQAIKIYLSLRASKTK